MANKNLYNILGIGKDADEKEIKSAYRKAAKYWHPDRWGDKSDSEKKNAEEKFKEITEAYEILSDKDKKAQYDMFGTTDFSNGGGYSSGMDTDDIFETFMRSTGFGNPFGGFGHSGRAQQFFRGDDKKIKISVTLEDVYFERFKTVKYEVERPCDECGGKGSSDGKDVRCPYCGGTGMITQTQRFAGGMVTNSQPCPHCHGTGRVVSNPCGKCGGTGVTMQTVERGFKVPKIDKLTYTYKMDLEGNACHNNRGNNGDLYFTFALRENANSPYHIDETNPYNIVSDIDVSVFDCLTGCDKDVKCIDGTSLKLHIPQGTKDGYAFGFSGKGFKASNGGVGKFIVRVNMVMPKLNDKQIKKIKDIAKTK